ncbi:MAG: pilus assembly protein PilP [Nitrospinota bacterium]|nr:pilus assembly protein PilP [Nitrospinota bacterium]
MNPILIAANKKKGSAISFDEKVLRQIIREREKTVPKTESLEKGYHLDPKYLHSRQRDPFVPLMTESQSASQIIKAKRSRKKAVLLKQSKKTRKFREFGDEINSLKTIPLELYRNLKDHDQDLYAQLEGFGRLFGNKGNLRRLTIDVYFKKVGQYKRLIRKANDIAKIMAKTKLQTNLNAMRLVGIIFGAAEPVALVETSGSKGYTVRKGMFIGSNFGIVESIKTNGITVSERSRNFLGEIESNSRDIQLVKRSRVGQGKS